MAVEARIARPEAVEDRLVMDTPERRAHWTGEPADVRIMHKALGTDQLLVNVLVFEPGVRSRPHTHSYDQLLYYVSGTGVVAVDGGEDQIVQAGEFVLLPAGVVHMHGAADDSPACHISMMRDVDNDFDPPLPAGWEKWRRPAV